MELLYLDHAAATPLRPEVRESMAPFLEGNRGNPSSIHRWGRAAHRALEGAREQIASLVGAQPDELHFTRGGTESLNLAILGRGAWVRRHLPGSTRFLRSTLEHPAVREPLEALEREGVSVDLLTVGPQGTLDRSGLRGAGIGLVSMQWVNQETGMVLPIPEVAGWCEEAGVPLQVDAVQAAGRLPMDLSRTPIALLTLSAHKIGGPIGTGLLRVRRGTGILPYLFGGGQEGGLRPGTEDVAGAVGFARAFEIAVARLGAEAVRLTALRLRLEEILRDAIPGLRIHGGEARRAPHILGIGVPGLPRDLLPGALDLSGLAVSAGSACRSGSIQVSPVLEALYGEDAASFAPLRLSLGWTTTEEEIESAAARVVAAVELARAAGVGG